MADIDTPVDEESNTTSTLATPPLLQLDGQLCYPNSIRPTAHLKLSIYPTSSFGGHAILGPNGSGKSLLTAALSYGSSRFGPKDSHLHSGTLEHSQGWTKYSVSTVSFHSHESLLQEGGTAYTALTPHGGMLSKAAQFLVVRFGLYPLLHRPVSTLSTGEIRKVLLVRALSTRPRLLVLDNAFDGLDVESRANLADLVRKTLRGFRNDILVQGVQAKSTARTQVVMCTHRPEELVEEIGIISWLDQPDGIRTELRGETLRDSNDETKLDFVKLWDDGMASEVDWEEPTLPSLNDISTLWNRGPKCESSTTLNNHLVVSARNLRVVRGDAVLLSDLDWTVCRGERWLVAGGNGAGKSTLSRLLARKDLRSEISDESTLIVSEDDKTGVAGVGWVSTEYHLSLARTDQTAGQVLLGSSSHTTPVEVGQAVAEWLGIDSSILSRPFCELSQGEQKMVLIAAAIARRPKVLILDEPMQGLDLINRKRVLQLVERLCRATDISLVYITHHLEELIPSVTQVLHLKDGKSVYCGKLESYNPDDM